MLETFERCIEDGLPWDLILPITTAKGRNIWIQSRGDRICENGIAVKLVGAIQDVSEEKNAEIYPSPKKMSIKMHW